MTSPRVGAAFGQFAAYHIDRCEALGWEPKVPLRNGREETIAYFAGSWRRDSRVTRPGPILQAVAETSQLPRRREQGEDGAWR